MDYVHQAGQFMVTNPLYNRIGDAGPAKEEWGVASRTVSKLIGGIAGGNLPNAVDLKRATNNIILGGAGTAAALLLLTAFKGVIPTPIKALLAALTVAGAGATFAPGVAVHTVNAVFKDRS